MFSVSLEIMKQKLSQELFFLLIPNNGIWYLLLRIGIQHARESCVRNNKIKAKLKGQRQLPLTKCNLILEHIFSLRVRNSSFLKQTVQKTAADFLNSFVNPNTKRSYTIAFNSLCEQGFLNAQITLLELSFQPRIYSRLHSHEY